MLKRRQYAPPVTFSSTIIRVRAHRLENVRLTHNKNHGERRAFISQVVIVLMLAPTPNQKKYFGDLMEFVVLLAGNLSSRKYLVNRVWLLTTAAWRTQHPHTRHKEWFPFRELYQVGACDEM